MAAQYEVSVFRYGSDGSKDGFEIQICTTPPLEEHIGLLDAGRFLRARTAVKDDHSEHYLTMHVDKATSSDGAFCATIVHEIAIALKANVEKLIFESRAFCTASLLVGGKTYDPAATKPKQPTKRKDCANDFYIVTPLAFWGVGEVKDMREKESCKRRRVE